MTSPFAILGATASGALIWAAQEWFRKEYLRRYGPARLDGRWHMLWGPDDRAAIAHALIHPDADPAFERIRRVALTLVVVEGALFIVFGFAAMHQPMT